MKRELNILIFIYVPMGNLLQVAYLNDFMYVCIVIYLNLLKHDQSNAMSSFGMGGVQLLANYNMVSLDSSELCRVSLINQRTLLLQEY
jgi:hypothetical protein